MGGIAKCSVDCWVDKAEEVWKLLQGMAVWSSMGWQTSADGVMVTITLAYEPMALHLHHYERLAQLVRDGDAITLYPELDDEQLRQWQEDQADVERWDAC